MAAFEKLGVPAGEKLVHGYGDFSSVGQEKRLAISFFPPIGGR